MHYRFFKSRIYLIRVIKWRIKLSGNVADIGDWRGGYKVLVEKPEGRRPLGRTRRRWEDIIKVDFQEVGCEIMDWIDLAHDRFRCRVLVLAVMNILVP
jgi:hypothetical protein